ncbi:MAG: hypothetical protein ACI4IJ_09330 [Acutalibacteraceae bacterium]
MKKKIITVMLAAAMAASVMTSCTVTIGSSKDKDTSSDSVVSSVSDTSSDEVSDDNLSSDSTSSTSPVNLDDIDISNDWNSWQIAVDGVVYTMPCDISDFEKNGWTLENADGTLKSNQYTLSQPMKKGDLRIYVQIINLSDNEINIADGKVGQVKIDANSEVPIVLPGKLVFDENLTVEDIKAKYGEPKRENEGDNYVTLTYTGELYQSVDFFIYKPDSGMTGYSSVAVRNFGVN